MKKGKNSPKKLSEKGRFSLNQLNDQFAEHSNSLATGIILIKQNNHAGYILLAVSLGILVCGSESLFLRILIHNKLSGNLDGIKNTISPKIQAPNVQNECILAVAGSPVLITDGSGYRFTAPHTMEYTDSTIFSWIKSECLSFKFNNTEAVFSWEKTIKVYRDKKAAHIDNLIPIEIDRLNTSELIHETDDSIKKQLLICATVVLSQANKILTLINKNEFACEDVHYESCYKTISNDGRSKLICSIVAR